MIQDRTILTATDNSGAKKVRCIKVYKKGRQANINDVILVSVQTLKPHAKLKKGSMHKALVVRTKKEFHRQDGSLCSFADNAVVLLSDSGKPLGTRVFGPVTAELREQGHLRIASLADAVV